MWSDQIRLRKPWHALPGGLYTSPAVLEAERSLVWGAGWIFAAHSCEVAGPGRFVRLDLGDASLLVVRGDDGIARALHNVCRHRGSRVCDEPSGCVQRFVCPYHRWVYEIDGALSAAPGMDNAEIAGVESGLRPAACREVAGLVFVSLAQRPPSFEDAGSAIGRELMPHGFAGARIAAERRYTIEANWKLVFENNRECYHCPGSHPEYCRANFDVARDRGRRTDEVEAAIGALAARLGEIGISSDGLGTSSAMSGAWFRANRTPNAPGFVTESLDGEPVCTPMGGLPTIDVGTARVTVFPSFWCHASGDHAMTTRLVPLAPDRTEARICWLVDGDAIEGRDYEVDRLTPFWQRTSEQDWEICRRQQRGVSSPAYTPGPLSREFEPGVEQFLDWYGAAMLGEDRAWA